MELKTMTDWIRFSTDIKIEELRQYLDVLKIQLDSMVSDFDKKIETEAQKIDDKPERDNFYESCSEEYWNYKETFPRILLNSFHVTSVTLLESELFSIASRIGKKQNQLFDVSEIKGNDYIQSACYYIEKLTRLDCKTFETWNEIIEGRRFRNIITHSNGKIKTDTEMALVKKYKINYSALEFPSTRPIHQIFITYEYSESFLATQMKFFHKLYDGIKTGDYL